MWSNKNRVFRHHLDSENSEQNIKYKKFSKSQYEATRQVINWCAH